MKTTTIGQILHAERQKRKFSLERVSEITHIRLEYLQALERDEYEILPTAAYVRGFIRSYARVLNVDSKPLLAVLRRDYKETAKGGLIPREFLRSFRPQKLVWTPLTWVAILLAVVVGVLCTYLLLQWYRFSRPPTLEVLSPTQRQEVAIETTVSGFTEPGVLLTINDQPIATQPNGSFTSNIRFPSTGMGIISVTATNRRGQTTEELVVVTVQE